MFVKNTSQKICISTSCGATITFTTTKYSDCTLNKNGFPNKFQKIGRGRKEVKK